MLEIFGKRTGFSRPGITMPPRRENNLARQIVAVLAKSNLLNPALRANTNDRAMEAMRAFCCMKPPQFDGESSDPLVADHWLSQIRKIFNALKITKDDLRVSIIAVQLTVVSGEPAALGSFSRLSNVHGEMRKCGNLGIQPLVYTYLREVLGAKGGRDSGNHLNHRMFNRVLGHLLHREVMEFLSNHKLCVIGVVSRVTFVLSVHNDKRHISFAVQLIILQEDALIK
ncbi:hypothetical protein RHMOL_Rhmol02G0194200 [Rhododendron molle]|uniref:Uncharacterized protein n=1 Tax=Rhododendron molle TaxID=49168 RepID=A0ACC0PTA6_RHOML|nr:hypothetical protein RHMOL_Rhmol02G0194200 [Rhododendron molle]